MFAIRIGIYEEIKDMTPEERVNYFHVQTAPMIKELGLEYSYFTACTAQKEKESSYHLKNNVIY